MTMADRKPKTSASRRRKVLKSLVAGGGALGALKVLPDRWVRPKVDAVMLPAHAVTSQCFSIACTVGCHDESDQCLQDAIAFGVTGQVAACDGSSLSGIELTVSYSNTLSPGDVPATVEFTIFTQANGSFIGNFIAVPPVAQWGSPEAIVRVAFADTATYGDAFCEDVFNCDEECAAGE